MVGQFPFVYPFDVLSADSMQKLGWVTPTKSYVVAQAVCIALLPDWVPKYSMWGFWWTKWYWDRLFFKYFSLLQPIIISPMIHTHLSTMGECEVAVPRKYLFLPLQLPITGAARSKAWIVFPRSNARIVGSNPNQDMDVCVYFSFVYVLCCM
jgi:hypothetical protein